VIVVAIDIRGVIKVIDVSKKIKIE